MNKHIITQSKGPDISFSGESIGHVSSHNGTKDRWTELSVYHTEEKNYVLVISGLSVLPHEERRVTCHVVGQLKEIVPIIRWSWLAKKLYKQMKFRPVQEV